MTDAAENSSEIERDVERTRSDVSETIDELKARFSPEAMMDYGSTYMRGPGGQRLLGAVRENPLAAVIAVVGIGWLLYTANRPPSGGRVDLQTGQDGSRPGVMGDWSEEQNLNQPGDPTARITREEVEGAFGRDMDS